MTPTMDDSDSDQEQEQKTSSKVEAIEVDDSTNKKSTNEEDIFEVDPVKPKIILNDDCAPTKG